MDAGCDYGDGKGVLMRIMNAVYNLHPMAVSWGGYSVVAVPGAGC